MVIDAFYILNELDLLEIRLNILNDVVDKFVIVEATETFSGVPKKLCYDPVRFAKWKNKIIYYVVDDYPEDDEIYFQALESPNTGNKEEYWIREFYQKESLKKALKELDNEDVVFVSDVDEIWNPEIKIPTLPINGNDVYKPKQLPYLYYLNQRTSEDWLGWTGTIATKYKNIKNACINHLRTDSMTDYIVIPNGGWHFCTLGGIEEKMRNWVNPEYDTFETILRLRREKDMRIDEVDLPQYLLDNKSKWKSLFL